MNNQFQFSAHSVPCNAVSFVSVDMIKIVANRNCRESHVQTLEMSIIERERERGDISQLLII